MTLTPQSIPQTSPPTGQKDVQELPGILQPSPLTRPSETFLTPSMQFCSLDVSCLMPCNQHCTSLHHNLVSTDRLCCVSGEWTRVWFHNTFMHKALGCG